MVGRLELFGFKNEVPALVAVHPAVALAAVAMRLLERALKHIALVSGGVGFVYTEQFTELYDEALCDGQFAGSNAMPALYEYFGRIGVTNRLVYST